MEVRLSNLVAAKGGLKYLTVYFGYILTINLARSRRSDQRCRQNFTRSKGNG